MINNDEVRKAIRIELGGDNAREQLISYHLETAVLRAVIEKVG